MPLPYLPARLRRNKRWDIIYYQTNPLTEKRERFRFTFELNRIPSIRERTKIAMQKIREINERLPFGYPFEEYYSGIKQEYLTKAIELARRIKTSTDSNWSRNTYNSVARIFIKYLEDNKMDKLYVSQFGFHNAQQFMDHCLLDRGIGNTTYNNYLNFMNSIFNMLKDRKYVEKNPFTGIKKRRAEDKKRRAFNDYEKTVIANYAYETNPFLFLAILLQYHCFIRPTELLRLRFEYFDLNQGVIRLPSSVSKKDKRNAILTIPNDIIPTLRELGLEDHRGSWIIFGKGYRPHPTTPVSKNKLGDLHREILKELKKKGMLDNIEGLVFYSWKDTGALELFKNHVNVLEIMRQLRHKELNTTQKYCQSLYMINSEIKKLSNPLITLRKIS